MKYPHNHQVSQFYHRSVKEWESSCRSNFFSLSLKSHLCLHNDSNLSPSIHKEKLLTDCVFLSGGYSKYHDRKAKL